MRKGSEAVYESVRGRKRELIKNEANDVKEREDVGRENKKGKRFEKSKKA